MVKQGQIIRINFNPQSGHEQRGTRPALVVSNDFFNEKANMTIVCPITNTDNKFPLHVPLDERTVTTGVVLCEHIRSMDIQARGYTVIEELPADLLEKVLEIVQAQLEKE
ncbi:MAG: type II toxin-antitoxin system PemK/MazF family toxin [Oscillospiraceae bacterium]|nr:type II toxin-antitoxin system PemK/MazF family toxin [Oscillospiraceae bacterium]